MKTISIILSLLFTITLSLNAQQWVGQTGQTSDIYRAGNVGIGTGSSLDGKLTVQGDVNIGGTGNYTLKVPRINGKSTNSTGVGFLYLNYNTGKDIFLGYGNSKSSIWVGDDINAGGNLSIGGDMMIGGNANKSITTRYILGKQDGNSSVGDLYLNYNTAKPVHIGYGGKASSLHVSGQIYVNSGWLRVYGNRGIFFQDHGGGLYMKDNTWIRTHGNKSFYHNTGIMRTDGSLQAGPNGNRFLVKTNGNVGINTTTPDYRLDVNGTVRAKEVRVQSGWSDHVFLPEYQLPTLQNEEDFINTNGHLIGFESEKDMNGEIQLADVTNRQQAKIEEIMLHLIDLNKKFEELKTENQQLKQENQQLKAD